MNAAPHDSTNETVASQGLNTKVTETAKIKIELTNKRLENRVRSLLSLSNVRRSSLVKKKRMTAIMTIGKD